MSNEYKMPEIVNISKLPDYQDGNWSRGRSRYDWYGMKNIGDSFLVTDRTIRQMCASAALCAPARLKNWKFKCRTEYNEDGSKRGIRVIRIA